MRLFLVLLIIVSQLAEARARSCKELLLDEPSVDHPSIRYKIAIDSQMSSEEKAFLQRYIDRGKSSALTEVLHEIDEIVDGKLQIPTEVEINLRRRTDQKFVAWVDPITNGSKVSIDAALQFSPHPYLKPEIYAHHALAHEYGHHILHLNLYQRGSAIYRKEVEFKSQIKFANELLTELRKQEDIAFMEAYHSGLPLKEGEKRIREEKFKMLSEERHQAGKAHGELLTQVDSLTFKVLGPYDELFADVVAVVRGEDGRAIRNMFDYQGAPVEGCKLRDFTAKIHDVPKDVFWDLQKGHYWLLTPVRSHLWAHYLSKLKAPSKKRGEFLKRLFEAIFEEVEVRMAEGKFDNVAEANRLNTDLIQRIDQKMVGF